MYSYHIKLRVQISIFTGGNISPNTFNPHNLSKVGPLIDALIELGPS